ncbi:MAG: DUF6962 family protein, partial [Pirellulales bacterium]
MTNLAMTARSPWPPVDVALTDYAVALEGALFVALLQRQSCRRPELRSWIMVFFASVSIASFCGGTSHGFFLDEQSLGYAILWPTTLIAMGLTALSMWVIGARLTLSERVVRWVCVAAAGQFALTTAVVLCLSQNQELFSLAIGGYGLFGVIAQVTLRLVPRTKVERVVEVIAVKDLLTWIDKRLEQGFVYGDCQYSTDLDSDAESHQGVLSCYRPLTEDRPIEANQKQLSDEDWRELYKLARSDKKKAFQRYSTYYL